MEGSHLFSNKTSDKNKSNLILTLNNFLCQYTNMHVTSQKDCIAFPWNYLAMKLLFLFTLRASELTSASDGTSTSQSSNLLGQSLSLLRRQIFKTIL